MSWLLLLLILLPSKAGTAPSTTDGREPVGVTISAKTDKDGRWCSAPVFQAELKNHGSKSLWLDLGELNGEVFVSGYSVCYGIHGDRGCEGGANGRIVDFLRGPDGMVLKAGESVTRVVKLDHVRLKAGRIKIVFTVLIRGTDDLDDSKLHTYTPEVTADLRLRRHGSCFEVRRLTGRLKSS
jgi:hypothetical protein